MAVKVVHVSDVSEKQGNEDELGTLEVLEHPEIGEAARLEIFPDEFAQLQAAERVVRLRWTPPRRPQVPRADRAATGVRRAGAGRRDEDDPAQGDHGRA